MDLTTGLISGHRQPPETREYAKALISMGPVHSGPHSRKQSLVCKSVKVYPPSKRKKTQQKQNTLIAPCCMDSLLKTA